MTKNISLAGPPPGQADPCGDGGAATSAFLAIPYSTAVEPNGNLLVQCVFELWRVTVADGKIHFVAGSTIQGFAGDGGSVGTAVMSMILTNQFNRSENIVAANKLAALQQKSAVSGVPLDQSAIPRHALGAGFWGNVVHDLSHAYTAVFAIAVVLVLSTIIPINYQSKDAATWCSPAQSYRGNWNVSWGFKSNHSGGANFLFGDGSVHFLQQSIDHRTYQLLGCRNDGQAPGNY